VNASATKDNFRDNTESTTTAVRRSRRIANKAIDSNNDVLSSVERQQKKVQDIFQSEVVVPELSSHLNSSKNIASPSNTDFDMNSISSASISSSSTMTLRHRNQSYNKVLASSLDATQIELDVLRCTWHLLTKAQKRSQQQYLLSLGSSNRSGNPAGGTEQLHPTQQNKRKLRKIAKMIHRKQRRLSNLINLTLVQSYSDHSAVIDPTLRYYQGYHDVACIILSTMGISSSYARYVPPRNLDLSSDFVLYNISLTTGFEMATSILYQLSQSHFRDFMRTNFQQLQIVMRLTIYPLLLYFDSEVHEHLMQCDMMEPYFALSWIITWFSHDIRDTELVKRLFDLFIVSHPLMPIYLTIAMICHPLNRQDILQTERDFSTVHQALSTLPRNSSMVGWKYRPGDGYVSDDDDNDNDGHSSDDDEFDDDDLLSIGPMGSQSSVDTEFLLQEAATLKQSNTTTAGCKADASTNKSNNNTDYVADAEAVSIVSSSMSSLYTARVPFQELIDLAIQFMERIPPKNLVLLATRYHGDEYVQKELFSQSPKDADGTKTLRNDITFLQSPPTWTRSYTAHSDQTLKYYRSQQRRSRLIIIDGEDSASKINDNIIASDVRLVDMEPEDGSMYKVFQASGDTDKLMAVIAVGYGLGDDLTERRRNKRRQRKRFIQAGTTLAVMVVAIGVGYYVQQQNRTKQLSTVSPTTDSSGNSSTCMSVVNGPFTKSSSSNASLSDTKIIATSVKTTKSLTPSTVDFLECKNQRKYPFERKCPAIGVSSGVSVHHSHRIVLNRRNEASGEHSKHTKEGIRELGTTSVLLYQDALRELLVFGNRIQDLSSIKIESLLKESASKSKHFIFKTRSAILQKSRDIQIGAIALRENMEVIPHHVKDLFHTLYHDGLSRAKNVIRRNRQSLIMKTCKVANVAKSALLEYENDDMARRGTGTVAATSPHIIVTLRKKFEPSDLNIISDHLHLMIINSVYYPIRNLMYKFETLRHVQIAQFTDIGEKKLIALFHSLREQMLRRLDVSRQHLAMIITSLNEKKQQLNLFDNASLRERVAVHSSKVLDAVQSKAVRNTLFSASILGHYSTEKRFEKMDNPRLLLTTSVDRNTVHKMAGEDKDTIEGEDRCLSNLSMNQKKKMPFVMNAKVL
jgi:Rab-GTPase-TBC domain